MSKPRLLDLFCGAGGAAMGYHRAGFDVVGVDILPQPRYPFEFHQADAMTFPLEGFDAIHASPPCQGYSIARHVHGGSSAPLLVPSMRAKLLASGVPWIMENVEGAPMIHGLMLCGTMFGLNLRRHRRFDSSHLLMAPVSCHHAADNLAFGRKSWPEAAYRAEMGVEWMRLKPDARQAIPPAYTEWLGRQLLAAIENMRAA